jgi:CspA family cold shock protein
MSCSAEVTNSHDILTGRVKWFNNKSGFGFLTITDGLSSGLDVFVHHSSIKVNTEQYKYLVQGEYVEFELTETSGGAHKYQASNVKGIKGGSLMCETRRELKVLRNNYKTDNKLTVQVLNSENDNNEWNRVVRRNSVEKEPLEKKKRGRKPKVISSV